MQDGGTLELIADVSGTNIKRKEGKEIRAK